VSLSSEQRIKLMSYVDGEVDSAGLIEVEKLLATSSEAYRFVEQVADLGDLVEEGHAARLTTFAAAFDVADAVMARVEKGESAETVAKAPAAPAAGAPVRLEAARAASAARNAPHGEGGHGGSISRQRMKMGGAIAAALALAAAVFVYARPEEAPMGKAPVAINGPSQPSQPASPSPAGTSGTGVDVSTVESPGQNVSVFYLPSANELTTSVVVWVDETGEK